MPIPEYITVASGKNYMIWQGLGYVPISWLRVATGISTKGNWGDISMFIILPLSTWHLVGPTQKIYKWSVCIPVLQYSQFQHMLGYSLFSFNCYFCSFNVLSTSGQKLFLWIMPNLWENHYMDLIGYFCHYQWAPGVIHLSTNIPLKAL